MRLYRNYSINILPSNIAMDVFSWCSIVQPKENIKKNFGSSISRQLLESAGHLPLVEH